MRRRDTELKHIREQTERDMRDAFTSSSFPQASGTSVSMSELEKLMSPQEYTCDLCGKIFHGGLPAAIHKDECARKIRVKKQAKARIKPDQTLINVLKGKLLE